MPFLPPHPCPLSCYYPLRCISVYPQNSIHLYPKQVEWLPLLKEDIPIFCCYCFCSLAMSDCLQPHGLQHARLPCPSLSPGVCSDSCPLSQWCCLTISSSVAPFSFCLQSFPASKSFPMSWLFISGGQSIAASASVLPMNIQGWFSLGLIGLISLQSTGLSRVFSSTTVWKHQFFGTQLSLSSKILWVLYKKDKMLWLVMFWKYGKGKY